MKFKKPTRKDIQYWLIFVAVVVVINFATDWLSPILQRSAFFHGVMVVMGVVALPLFALVLKVENDPRPFPPTARYPRILMGLFFFSLAGALIFWGLGFWFPVARVIAYWLGGISVVSAMVFGTLILRADGANRKAKMEERRAERYKVDA